MTVAEDRVEWTVTSGGQDWRVAWHPPPDPPAGTNHGSAAVCTVGDQMFVQPWPAGPADKRRDHTIFYQDRADRARRTLRGIDQQITKAENAVAGKTPVMRNRYVRLTGAAKSVNRTLEARTTGRQLDPVAVTLRDDRSAA